VRPEKERKMYCDYGEYYIMPVFGLEPGTGNFIAQEAL
jgi:hypothetical protein